MCPEWPEFNRYNLLDCKYGFTVLIVYKRVTKVYPCGLSVKQSKLSVKQRHTVSVVADTSNQIKLLKLMMQEDYHVPVFTSGFPLLHTHSHTFSIILAPLSSLS